MDSTAAIVCQSLSKSYGKQLVPAVDNVSFEVKKGELFGLIGPDGAGKTTLFRMLTTLILPDTGSATVDGFDMIRDYQQIRNTVGYMPGKFSLYQDLSITENLEFFASLFNTSLEENYHLIKDIYIQIEPFKDRRAGKLSGGMKQKLALCCALIHKPNVLFLDEPTTGVDPVSRKEFWSMLKSLKQQGISIIVSTPYMDEAILCDRIALMQSGRILSIDSPANITSAYPETLYGIKAKHMYPLLQSLERYEGTQFSYAFGEYAHASFKGDPADLPTIRQYLEEAGNQSVEIKPIAVSIEDVFIRLLK